MGQWVFPPLAITIEAAEYPEDSPLQAIEKLKGTQLAEAFGTMWSKHCRKS